MNMNDRFCKQNPNTGLHVFIAGYCCHCGTNKPDAVRPAAPIAHKEYEDRAVLGSEIMASIEQCLSLRNYPPFDDVTRALLVIRIRAILLESDMASESLLKATPPESKMRDTWLQAAREWQPFAGASYSVHQLARHFFLRCGIVEITTPPEAERAAPPSQEELRAALRTAAIRLKICAGRMRGCNEDGGKHELIAEVDNWVEEAEAAYRAAPAAQAESSPLEPKCGQSERDARLLFLCYDNELIYYGPHACNRCGKLICKLSVEQGGEEFDYPETPIYPNVNWTLHACPAALSEKGKL